MYTCTSQLVDPLFVSPPENPFLRVVDQSPIVLLLSSPVLRVTVIGFFTVVNGTTEMASDRLDYQLGFQDQSDNEVMMTPIDVAETRPNEQYVKYRGGKGGGGGGGGAHWDVRPSLEPRL